MSPNIFRLLGDFSHLLAIGLLLHKARVIQSINGISFKSQFIYLVVYLTRYLDLFFISKWSSNIYNTIFKILFISSSGYMIYLMVLDTHYKKTRDRTVDSFNGTGYLFLAPLILAIAFPEHYTFREIAWAYSIWLESVAILPQRHMLNISKNTDNLTEHYIFALGSYRALYILNWIYRYFTEGHVDLIAWTAGVVQTALYADFFYHYYPRLKEIILPV